MTLKKMSIRDWRKIAKNTDAWKWILKEAWSQWRECLLRGTNRILKYNSGQS